MGAHSQSEERWFTLRVSSQGRLLAVAHTYTATGVASARVRIISAREATRSERQQYENIPR
ncbi:MAG: BrnT family toxin [Burkholderiaceae bacterium]|nr:BrnT family toxin [Burkholderiaceae bacterium]